MRSIDHRRHAQRDPGGVHLNDTGRSMARRVGAASPRYARVLSSPLPRAVETAAEIGGRAPEGVPELAPWDPSVDRGLGPIVTWADYARARVRSPAVRDHGVRLVSLLARIAASLPDGGAALLVSHGGNVELGAAAALPEADVAAWGGPAGYCEGIRLEYEQGRFVRGAPLRVRP